MGIDPTPMKPVAPHPGLLSRKFLVTCGALVMSFVLALLGKLTSDFATIAAVVVGSFHAAHAVQDWHKE